MKAIALNMQAIIPHQRTLAQRAINGDREALLCIGRNYGLYTWVGAVDEQKALQMARDLIAA